jgi:hypothetical protein
MAVPVYTVDLGLGGSFRQTLLDSEDAIVACWPLSELTTASSIRDIVDGLYPGTITGGDINMGYPVDIPEGALGLRLTGAGTAYMEVPHASALCLAGGAIDITFLWVTSTNDATNRCIVQKQDTNSSGNGWHVSMQNGAIEFYLKVAGVEVFNFQRGSIADGAVHKVRCCYDPTGTSTARIMIDGVLSGATVTGVSTLPGTTTANLRVGLFTDGAGQAIGVVSYVTLGTSGDHTLAATLQATLAWTAITSHVRGDDGLHLQYGIQGSDPSARVASIGTLQFVLRNKNPSTGAKGYYSIGHANTRTGFNLGNPVRLTATISTTTYFKFRGVIASVTPEPGQYGELDAHIVAVDWMAVAAGTNLAGLATQIDQDAWECLGFVVDLADKPPCSTAVTTSTGQFPYAFDNSQVESMSALTELQRIAMSDQFHVFLKGDTTTGGVLTLQSRAQRQALTASAQFADSALSGLEIAHDSESMVNRCQITYVPRTEGTPGSVLYGLQAPYAITSKANVVIEGTYADPAQDGVRIGAVDTITTVATTDYQMWSNSNGTGRDMTTSLQVRELAGANGVQFIVHNADDADGYITRLQLRGTPLYHYAPATVTHSDADSIRTYGARPVAFEMPYQADGLAALNAAILTVNASKDPLSSVRELRFTTGANNTLTTQALAREVGDLIEIKEAVTLGTVYRKFYIQHVRLDINAAGGMACAWTLAPVNSQNGFWILGTSILGTDTVLGWTD